MWRQWSCDAEIVSFHLNACHVDSSLYCSSLVMLAAAACWWIWDSYGQADRDLINSICMSHRQVNAWTVPGTALQCIALHVCGHWNNTDVACSSHDYGAMMTSLSRDPIFVTGVKLNRQWKWHHCMTAVSRNKLTEKWHIVHRLCAVVITCNNTNGARML